MVVAAPEVLTRRSFVPAALDAGDFARLEPLYHDLLERRLDTPEQMHAWLADFAELTAAVDECGARRYIDMTCHTDDPAIERAYLHFVENVEPRVKPLYFRLQKKFLESPARWRLVAGDGFSVLARNWAADVELFRQENVPLDTDLTKLANDYNKVMGEMMVPFRGREYTPSQMARFAEDNDRTTRQAAWEANVNRRLRDRERLDEIFDRQLPLRERVARNAGLPDYRAYMWKVYKRFDYTPADCQRFADAIAVTCVPLVERLNAERARDLGVPALRPWDLDVDPKGLPALAPFPEDRVDLFVEKTREIFQRLSPDLARDFDELSRHNNLDLASRRGKAPGGYQRALEESRQPFIFMNATGLQRDVETLLHEAGHAFHYLSSRNQLLFVRSAPMEFCEVASMGMELLGAEHLDIFYDPADAARAKRRHLEGIIRFLPWMAVIDSFQHWIYIHPGHSRAQRDAEWVRLLERFTSGVDFSGYEAVRESMWHRQLHLYEVPFYYIEYGIAQLGALQLWLKAKQDPRRTLANYRSALSLGGTRPLPGLFAAAGIEFDFSERTLRPLMQAIEQELAEPGGA
jgi:oligoendopeptidase F